MSNTQIAQKVGITRNTVIAWRARYTGAGIDGLSDSGRSGRPWRIAYRAIMATTLASRPKKLRAIHWSFRLLAGRLGIDYTTVAKSWREYGMAPWLEGTSKFSTASALVAMVGAWLALPDAARKCGDALRVQEVPGPGSQVHRIEVADASWPPPLPRTYDFARQ